MGLKAPESQELGETLTRHYRLSCELCNTYPVGRYTHQFSQANLHINLSEVEPEQLEAICHTLNSKLTPIGIIFFVPNKRNVEVRIIQRLINGLSTCLLQSISLQTLQLQNIDIKGKSLSSLCKALSRTKNLSYFSLIHCKLGDAGTQQLCQAIKNIPSLFHLTLVGCQITEKGANAVSNLIKHQSLNRDSAMWQDTLRVGQPILDNMRGLRRVTLSLNPHLGDEGVIALCQVLKEDLWIKAIDLHHCGISAEAGAELLSLVKMNQVIEVVDIRQNPFLEHDLMHKIIAALAGRSQEYAPHHYEWLPLLSEDHYPVDTLAAAANVPHETQLSYNVLGYTSDTRRRQNTSQLISKLGAAQQVSTKKPQLPNKQGIPWRVEHRIYERKEGLPPGASQDVLKAPQVQNVTLDKQIKSISSIDDTTDNQCDKPDHGKYISLHKIRKLLAYYKKKFQKEHNKRKKFERKYEASREKLSSGHLLDEVTITHIETCFMKFQEFLNHLRVAGYEWQKQIMKDPIHGMIQESIGIPDKYNVQKDSSYSEALIMKHQKMEPKMNNSQLKRETSAKVNQKKRLKNVPAEVCNFDMPPSVIPVPIMIQVNNSNLNDNFLNKKVKECKPQEPLDQQKSPNSFLATEKYKEKELIVLVEEDRIGIGRKHTHPSSCENQENIINSLHRELEIGKNLLNKRTIGTDIDHKIKEKFEDDKFIDISDGVDNKREESNGNIFDEDNDCYQSVVEVTSSQLSSEEPISARVNKDCKEKNPNESNESNINPESSSISIEVTVSSEDNRLQGITITSLHDQEEQEEHKHIQGITITSLQDQEEQDLKLNSNIISSQSDVVNTNLASDKTESPVLISVHLEEVEVETNNQSEMNEMENYNSDDNVEIVSLDECVESDDLKLSSSQTSSNSIVDYISKKDREYARENPIKNSLKQEKMSKNITVKNEASETDDEKLKQIRTSISSLYDRSASACSYTSISEQLSQSHNKWSKGKTKTPIEKINTPNNSTSSSYKEDHHYGKFKYDESFKESISSKFQEKDIDAKSIVKERSPAALIVRMPGGNEYGSDFEVSDIEGLSLSASSLTSTSINDALNTQIDDNF